MIGEIPCICKSMLRSPVLLDGLRMYISDDPKIIKELTNMAVVKLPSAEKAKDLGNYCYDCLFHALAEIARGKNLDIYSDFARLGNKWPTLARKWQASERSLKKKGDVIELCIFLCNKKMKEKGGDSDGIYTLFHANCAKFHYILNRIAMELCIEGEPTTLCLPHPRHFIRLMLFCHYSIRHDEEAIRQICSDKSLREMRLVKTRMGILRWD